MIRLVSDLRFAFRRYRTALGPTLAVVITLALGIGANTAIFSLVDGVWLRPLAIADPAHLIAITSVKNHAAADAERADTSSSYAELLDVRSGVPAFADVAGIDHRGVALETTDGIVLLTAEVVSDNFFRFAGVHPELGHLPTEAEIHSASTPLIVISYGTWKRVFAANPHVIGQPVNCFRSGAAVIAAVLPAGFHGEQRTMDPQVYVPRSTWMAWFPQEGSWRTYRNFDVYARLRPGATLEQARAQLQALSADLAVKYPEANRGRSLTAGWEREGGMPLIKQLSLLLLGVGAAILLIACTNIANVLLALHDGRRREIAMRVALGASRAKLVLQLVTEYSLLALSGIALALILADRLIALVPLLIPQTGIAILPDFRIDHRVLIFAASSCALTVLLCGVLPGLASTRISPIEAMRAQAAAGRRFRMPARKIFVAAQLTVSMALLIVTGMLVHAIVRIQTMDMGFSFRQSAVVLQLEVSREGAARLAEAEAIAGRMRALPGVKDATVSRVVPFCLMGGGATEVVLAPGETPSPTAGTPVWFNQVDSSYFRVLGVPILRGRAFGSEDSPTAPRVVIVNQALARHLFGTDDVTGRHLRMGREKPIDAEIVGVTRDGKYADIAEAPQPYLYLPLAQDNWSDMALTATTAGDPRALLPAARKAVHEVDPDAIVTTAETMTSHMELATYANRLAAGLTASLGALALLLTMIGLYGVIAYSVSRHRKDIGIRMALGANRNAVGARIVSDGLRLVIAGVALGSALAFFAGRSLAGVLFGVTVFDPLGFLSVLGVMLVVSLAALIIPARQALKVDPAVALRDE